MIIKALTGYPGYFASDTGRIFSTKGRFREIKQQVHKVSGYRHFSAWDGKRSETVKVHIAVATAFHGNRPQGLACAHLDGDKSNNSASNLVWVTSKENNAHKKMHGTYLLGSAVGSSKLKEAEIPVIRYLLNEGTPITQVAKTFNVDPATIRDIRQGVTWTHV